MSLGALAHSKTLAARIAACWDRDVLDVERSPDDVDIGSLSDHLTCCVSRMSAIKKSYAPLYEADENAHLLPADELKGLIAQVSGTEEGLTNSSRERLEP